MSKRKQPAFTVRMLPLSVVQREEQTHLDENMLPPRSKLYGMAPCGEGLWSESLTSYLNRLGWRHGVAPRVLIAQEVTPYLNINSLPLPWEAFYSQSPITLLR